MGLIAGALTLATVVILVVVFARRQVPAPRASPKSAAAPVAPAPPATTMPPPAPRTPPTAPPTGVTVRYQLPHVAGQTQTYRVTLAAAPANEPDWLVANFVSGLPVEVNDQNQGRFEATWDGLDDNNMPVPPGAYRIKGIWMPARKWHATDEWHSVIPKYVMAVGDSWSPPPEGDMQPPHLTGHQFGPMADVYVSSNGVGAFIPSYIESARSPFLVDFKKDIGYDQVLQTFPSSGGTEGTADASVATDGERLWVANWNLLIRADRQWGTDKTDLGVLCIKTPMTAPSLAAWHDPASGKRFLYVAQAVTPTNARIDKVLVYDGEVAAKLGELAVREPRALFLDPRAPGTALHALCRNAAGAWVLAAARLEGGIPVGPWHEQPLPPAIKDPVDATMDSGGNVFVVDAAQHRIAKVAPTGVVAGWLGRAYVATGEPFNPARFWNPRKITSWRAPGEDVDRLVILEGGPTGRTSEWTTGGKFLRQWLLCRTAVRGFALDPAMPEHLHIASDGGGIMRFRLDYTNNTWQPDFVQPVLTLGGPEQPRIVNLGGRKYLTFGGGQASGNQYAIHRWSGSNWVASAGLIWRAKTREGAWANEGADWWHDANGDGAVQRNEFTSFFPAPVPATWEPSPWLADLSLVMYQVFPANAGGWVNRLGHQRLAPRGFDAHGNPVLHQDDWKPLFEDEIFHKRIMMSGAATGGAIPPEFASALDALHGGHEVPNVWHVGWGEIAGTLSNGFYWAYGFGPANPGGLDFGGTRTAQQKVTRWVPDGNGGFAQRWRVGRKAWRVAQPGELYSCFQVTDATYGLVGITDMNGLYHLYNADGFYVDTLMYDGFRFNQHQQNHYSHGGEFWFGRHQLNRRNGKVYLLMGRSGAYVYECEGWTPDLIKPLTVTDATVTLAAGQIAPAWDQALAVRGGAGKAPVVKFMASPGGGPALDGSLAGWEAAEPAVLALDGTRGAEVRCLYDRDHLYLRWHVKTPQPALAANLNNLEYIFAHDRGADTVSFYLQGDPLAPASDAAGRAGDVRIVFAAGGTNEFERTAVAVGMYPVWDGPGAGAPVTYKSPVRAVSFAHVAPLKDVKTAYAAAEGGYVIAAAIPRTVLPAALPAFGADLRTRVDFSVTLGGAVTFWWANVGGVNNTLVTDVPSEAQLYPGAWAQAQFVGIETLPVRQWLVCGPWGGEEFKNSPGGWDPGHAFAKQLFENTTYPPDAGVEPSAVYTGAQTMDEQKNVHELRWELKTTATDRLTPTAHKRELYFFSTWVWAPTACAPRVKVIAPATIFGGAKLWVNDAPVEGWQASGDYGVPGTFVANDTFVRLKAGWNQVRLRAYLLWGGMEVGVVFVEDDPALLWGLRVSATKPAEGQP